MLKNGTIIDGKYKILNKIGQGGMSIVYLAMNESANKQWAIKEVRKDVSQNFDVIKQGLITETNMLKKLNHPNLPSEYAKKMDSMKYAAVYLLSMGYEPEFVAGVLGNIISEGTAGQFESSNYSKHPELEPDYLVYLDNNYNYRQEFSGKNIMDVGIAKTEELMAAGKFGLGSCQWTDPGRAKNLLACYKEVCGDNNYPTKEQCMQAEALCMARELNGDYSYVYESWKNDQPATAASAGEKILMKYEIPKDASSQIGTRSAQSQTVYDCMVKN